MFLKKQRSALSIMELSIVIAVLGLLVVSYSTYTNLVKVARASSIVSDIETVSKAFTIYYQTNGTLPGDRNLDRILKWGSGNSYEAGNPTDPIESFAAYQDMSNQGFLSIPKRTNDEIRTGGGEIQHAVTTIKGSDQNVFKIRSYDAGIIPRDDLANPGRAIRLFGGAVGIKTNESGSTNANMTNGGVFPEQVIISVKNKINPETDNDPSDGKQTFSYVKGVDPTITGPGYHESDKYIFFYRIFYDVPQSIVY